MNSSDAIIDYITNQLNQLGDIYSWNFNLNDFPSEDYIQCGSNPYERSRNLRNMIHNEIINNSPLSESYQIWYVKNWGGVKTNKLKTLQYYLNSNTDELISLGSKGIATWSKILSVRNPICYAIYDARVAISLNSIQKLYLTQESILFPQLVSRNTSFVIPTQRLINQSEFFTKKTPSDFYRTYLDILSKSVSNNKNYDIQDAEMVLFSNAEKLSSAWK
jgi:hypothetical protein